MAEPVEYAIRVKLLGIPSVANLIPGGIQDQQVTEGKPQPYVVTRISEGSEAEFMGGSSGVAIDRIQFDCWGNTPDDAKAIRDAIRNAVLGFAPTGPGYVGDIWVQGIQGWMQADDFTQPVMAQDNGQTCARCSVQVTYNKPVPTFA